MKNEIGMAILSSSLLLLDCRAEIFPCPLGVLHFSQYAEVFLIHQRSVINAKHPPFLFADLMRPADIYDRRIAPLAFTHDPNLLLRRVSLSEMTEWVMALVEGYIGRIASEPTLKPRAAARVARKTVLELLGGTA